MRSRLDRQSRQPAHLIWQRSVHSDLLEGLLTVTGQHGHRQHLGLVIDRCALHRGSYRFAARSGMNSDQSGALPSQSFGSGFDRVGNVVEFEIEKKPSTHADDEIADRRAIGEKKLRADFEAAELTGQLLDHRLGGPR